MKRSQWKYMIVLMLGLMISVIIIACNNNSETVSETAVDERIDQAMQTGIPTMIVSNTEAKPGEKVTVSATLVNNPGILGSTMTLSYDETILELKSVKNGEAFDQILNMTNSKDLKSGCVFLWDGESITEEQILDGEILVMEFEVLKTASDAATPIVLVCEKGGTVNGELEPVELAMESGVVTIHK